MKINHTRRQFLKSGAAMAGAATLRPFHILHAAGLPASERITLGFIGLGRMGRSHIKNNFCKRPDVHGLAVCDVDTTRREHCIEALNAINAGKTGGADSQDVKGYDDYRDLLAREDIDAVVIATPDHWHARITLEALRAGKDVYCEKPLTHTPQEALAVMEEVKQQKRILQTGSQQRSYMPEFRVACEMVVNGVIGPIEQVNVYFGGPPRACDLPSEEMEPGLDWDCWIGPASMRSYHTDLCPRGVQDISPAWRRYWEFGGGGVMDFGAHHVDIARWGMQLDDEMPVEVKLPDRDRGGYGAQLVFANGVTFTHGNKTPDGAGSLIEFVGQKDRIRVGRYRFELWRGDDPRNREFFATSHLKKAEATYLTGPNIKQLYRCTDHQQDFLDALRSRRRTICHEDIGGRTAICCHLLNIAYRHQQDLRWDCGQNTFAPGGGDPAWLRRASYRRGYALPV